MRIFGRVFIWPILIHKTSTLYCGAPNLSIRWNKHRMGVSMNTTSYTIEISTPTSKWQYSFAWRPDVTRVKWCEKR